MSPRFEPQETTFSLTLNYSESGLCAPCRERSTTAGLDVKKRGGAYLHEVLTERDVPHGEEFDPECTDFLPAAGSAAVRPVDKDGNIKDDDTSTLGEMLKPGGSATLIFYPRKNSRGFTTSPLVDALQEERKLRQVAESNRHADEMIAEQEGTGKALSADLQSALNALKAEFEAKLATERAKREADLAGRDVRIAALEKHVIALEKHVIALEKHVIALEKDLEKEKKKVEDLENKLDDTSKAALGDRAAINRLRVRILLDKGRKALMTRLLPGLSKEAIEDMSWWTFIETHTVEQAKAALDKDPVSYWKALGSRGSALALLYEPKRYTKLRDRGNVVAHDASEKDLSESVTSFDNKDREDLFNIFFAGRSPTF